MEKVLPTMEQFTFNDPVILQCIREIESENKNVSVFFRNAITHYKKSCEKEQLEDEEFVKIRKSDLKKMYVEWNSFLQLRDTFMKPLSSFKPKTFIKIMEENLNIPRECYHCRLGCGTTFPSKISLSLHERKCKHTIELIDPDEMTELTEEIEQDEETCS